ncbi:leucine-rich repeat-containing protein 20 isoform X2 [Callorhinus ursinus]|uniref:leucine-rich repeat-containing protein 20 isoform X2 n=1 Tax=Callorhinus ursinus TaxID=34884 RepID=UPI003CD0111F
MPGLLTHRNYLAECKLVSFPIGIYKVLRNVTDQIHLITLANNELKSLTSKFMTTFCQLRELHLEGNFLHRLPNEVSTLQHLKAIDLSRNQFRDFPEQLTTLPALETINLEENDIVDVPVEKLAAMPALRSINLRCNPLSAEVRVIAPPLIKFDMLMSPEGARAPPALGLAPHAHPAGDRGHLGWHPEGRESHRPLGGQAWGAGGGGPKSMRWEGAQLVQDR